MKTQYSVTFKKKTVLLVYQKTNIMKLLIKLLELFYGINEEQFKGRKSFVDFRKARTNIWKKRRHFAH